MSEFDHVRDEACRQAFLDTRQIREELNELRKQKKEKIDQMQENRSVQKPEMERELHQLELKREKLFKEKDVLHRSISLSPEEQIARLEEDRKQDEFMAMVRSRRPIRDECDLLKQRIVDFTKKAELLNERVTRAHENAPKRPIAELLAEVKSSHAKLQKAHGSKVEANIAKASREHKLLQSQLDAANLYSTLQNEFLETAKAIEASHASLTKKGKELETIDKKMKAHDEATGRSADDKKDQKVKEAERDARKKERKAKVDKVHLLIDAKKLEIDALKDERKKINDKYDYGSGKELDALRDQINALEEKKEKMEKKINSKIVKDISVAALPALVGKQGATLKQIEIDFGVVIDIHRREQEVLIRGADAAECAEAVESLLEQAAADMKEATMKIDEDCTGEFIGPSGSNIQSLQTQSGAHIRCDNGDITITGNDESVQLAVELVEAFKAESFKDELRFNANIEPIMRPRLMKQWQVDYNCRLIKTDSSTFTITLRGKEASVNQAKAGIEQFCKNSINISIPSSVSTAALIGTKGSTIKSIEQVTGCILDVNSTRVLIAGTEEALVKAREVVEAKIAENTSEESKVPYPKSLHGYLTRRKAVPAKKHTDPEEEKKEEKEEEKEEGASPPSSPKKREAPADACLLEALRCKHDVFQARADLMNSCVHLRGPKDRIVRLEAELRALMKFEGKKREKKELPYSYFKYLTGNMLPRSAKGMKLRLDPVRLIEGVDEIIFDPRGDSTKLEIIGTEEGVAAALERIDNLLKSGHGRSRVFEIQAGEVGRLLGPRGQNLSDIEEANKVMIVVPKDSRSKPREAPVEITIFATAPPPEGVALGDHLIDAEKDARESMNGGDY